MAPAPRPRSKSAARSPRPQPRATRRAPGRRRRQIVGRPERRQAWVLSGFLVLLFVLGGRLVQVQALEGPQMAQEALSDRMSSTTLHAVRGDIVDGSGVPLATSVERYDVVVDQTQVAKFKKTDGSRVIAEGPIGAAELLGPVLDLDPDELALDLIGERRWTRIARGVTPEVWDQVRELRVAGVSSERVEERIYPAGPVAGNILGFLADDGVALAGLELVQDERLTGTDGSHVFERDAQRVPIPGGVERITPAVPGETLHLTIERDLQWQIQEIVDEHREKEKADYAVAIVQDVRTGDLLALADSGSVDPNDPAGTSADGRGSRAISDVLEPGSTSKVITIAALLEEGKFTANSRFSVPSTYTMPNGQSFKDATEHGVEKLTLTGILSRSSNVGTIMAGSELTKQEAYDYMRAFGFGQRTEIGLPGESRGILHEPQDWDGRTRYAVLFGQGLSVTALQATQVFATLGNDGQRVAPRIIKGWTDAEGVYHEEPAGAPTQVVSEQTAQTVVQMLESVVDVGTGQQGSVPGYRVGGKTGTAQAADGKGGYSGITASFIGLAPIEDPQIAVSVIIHRPRVGQWGSQVAGPVFSKVMGTSLQYLGIPPHDGSDVELLPSTYE